MKNKDIIIVGDSIDNFTIRNNNDFSIIKKIKHYYNELLSGIQLDERYFLLTLGCSLVEFDIKDY